VRNAKPTLINNISSTINPKPNKLDSKCYVRAGFLLQKNYALESLINFKLT